MVRRVIFSVLMLFAWARVTSAQDRGFAMVRRPLSSAEELASALEKRDMSLLRATPEQYLQYLKIVLPEENLSTVAELPAFFRALVVKDCKVAQGKQAILSRFMEPSKIIDLMWRRDFREGEQCLVSNNSGRYVVSLYCGNIILEPKSPPPGVMVITPPVEKPAPPRVAEVSKVEKVDTVRIKVIDSTRVLSSLGSENVRENRVLSFNNPSRIFFEVVKDTASKLPQKVPVPVIKRKTNWPLLVGVSAIVGTAAFFLGREAVTCKLCKPNQAQTNMSPLMNRGIVPMAIISRGFSFSIP